MEGRIFGFVKLSTLWLTKAIVHTTQLDSTFCPSYTKAARAGHNLTKPTFVLTLLMALLRVFATKLGDLFIIVCVRGGKRATEIIAQR